MVVVIASIIIIDDNVSVVDFLLTQMEMSAVLGNYSSLDSKMEIDFQC